MSHQLVWKIGIIRANGKSELSPWTTVWVHVLFVLTILSTFPSIFQVFVLPWIAWSGGTLTETCHAKTHQTTLIQGLIQGVDPEGHGLRCWRKGPSFRRKLVPSPSWPKFCFIYFYGNVFYIRIGYLWFHMHFPIVKIITRPYFMWVLACRSWTGHLAPIYFHESGSRPSLWIGHPYVKYNP